MSNTIYLHKCFIQCSDDDDEEYHTASPAIMCLKVGKDNIKVTVTCCMNNEKRMKQLRRRMRDIDRVWLSACMSLVEGDSNPVEAYLNSRVDPTWKLSHPEASYWRGQGQGCLTQTTIYVASKLAVSI